ncbi:kinase-like protein [Gigaspora margarita]|uniref:Kinase-like protein n=1 Tax=Gigaspora margarita TaxID=4874 RepID=A0A8H4A8T5_GIGMA|nr:kinase-like protein [Gigaspora margarita]
MPNTSEKWLEENKKCLNYYDHKKFKVIKKLGEGSFGTVHQYFWIENDFMVALKSSKFDTIPKFISETRILLKVNGHPNIIKFYGVTKDLKCIILQFAEHGNLREYLRKSLNLGWESKLRIAKEIAQGLLFLHNNDIIHRDLHSKNILVHNNGHIMISDFGLSHYVTEEPAVPMTSSECFGIVAFTDPQCFTSHKSSKKSDIYSLGVVLWEVSSGEIPFSNMEHYYIVNQTYLGFREKPVKGTPEKYIHLYEKCWDSDQNKRPESQLVLKKLKKLINFYFNDEVKIFENELYLTQEGISVERCEIEWRRHDDQIENSDEQYNIGISYQFGIERIKDERKAFKCPK